MNGLYLETKQTPRGWADDRGASSSHCCSNHAGLGSPDFLSMLASFMPQCCFLCSFIIRECNAFLSFTFSRGQNPTRRSKPSSSAMSTEVFPEDLPHCHIRKEFLITVVLLCLRGIRSRTLSGCLKLDSTKPYVYCVFSYTN